MRSRPRSQSETTCTFIEKVGRSHNPRAPNRNRVRPLVYPSVRPTVRLTVHPLAHLFVRPRARSPSRHLDHLVHFLVRLLVRSPIALRDLRFILRFVLRFVLRFAPDLSSRLSFRSSRSSSRLFFRSILFDLLSVRIYRSVSPTHRVSARPRGYPNVRLEDRLHVDRLRNLISIVISITISITFITCGPFILRLSFRSTSFPTLLFRNSKTSFLLQTSLYFHASRQTS